MTNHRDRADIERFQKVNHSNLDDCGEALGDIRLIDQRFLFAFIQFICVRR